MWLVISFNCVDQTSRWELITQKLLQKNSRDTFHINLDVRAIRICLDKLLTMMLLHVCPPKLDIVKIPILGTSFIPHLLDIDMQMIQASTSVLPSSNSTVDQSTLIVQLYGGSSCDPGGHQWGVLIMLMDRDCGKLGTLWMF